MQLPQIIQTLGLEVSRRVLVVEDNLDAANLIVEYLSQSGHIVTGLMGIDRIQDPESEGTNLKGEAATFSLKGFEVAFLDHYIESKTFTGADLIAPLKVAGVHKILAMSSVDPANIKMKSLGATLGIKKSTLLQLIAESY